MKLCTSDDMPADSMALCCRQSRVVGILRTVVWCFVLSLPPFLGWKFSLNWVFWLGVILLTILFPVMMKELLLLFGPHNWVARIGRDGLWINLLSYRDKPSSTPSIVHLDYDEIASANKHVVRYSTPSESTSTTKSRKIGGITTWRAEFLEFRLKYGHTDDLQLAQNQLRYGPAESAEQTRPDPSSRSWAVWVTTPTVIRVPWLTGRGHAVLPGLAYVLDQLGTYVLIETPTQHDWPDWRKMTPDEARELAFQLVNVYGDSIDASHLLVRVAGVSTSEAHTLTKQFAQERLPQNS